MEPPFSPAAFSLPPQINNMLYIGVSAFTINSAAFVYNKAGALSLYITDDMVSLDLLIPNESTFFYNDKLVYRRFHYSLNRSRRVLPSG